MASNATFVFSSTLYRLRCPAIAFSLWCFSQYSYFILSTCPGNWDRYITTVHEEWGGGPLWSPVLGGLVLFQSSPKANHIAKAIRSLSFFIFLSAAINWSMRIKFTGRSTT